jgi:hypothetical protein
VEFRVLGPLEVVGADGFVGIRAAKLRALLALLLLHANAVVSADALIDDAEALLARALRLAERTGRRHNAGASRRACYWASKHPIPGGVAFENFELGAAYRPGQEYVFSVEPTTG